MSSESEKIVPNEQQKSAEIISPEVKSQLQSLMAKKLEYLYGTKINIENTSVENIKTEKNITDFEYFKTAKGSVYRVLKNGQVQRTKTVLGDPHYRDDDKAENKERTPSDITLFIDPESNLASWFGGVSASRGELTVSQQIDIGIYKPDNQGEYHLVTKNIDLDSSCVLVWVNDKKDAFKLNKEVTFDELKNFDKRWKEDSTEKVGFLYPINIGGIKSTPVVGYDVFDYRYGKDGKIESMHNGNKVTSINERGVDEKEITPTLNVSEIVKDIRDHMDEQPASVQELFSDIDNGVVDKNIFSKVCSINGYNFLITKKVESNGYIFCLVQDTDNPHKWKSRGFHFSNSDHQLKLNAGSRKNGNVMKGEESNPMHHYVQSGKVAKELYKLFDTLDIVDDNKCTGLINRLPDFETHKFENEFELKEQFLELKNPEWNKFQKQSQNFYYGDYRNLVSGPLRDPINKTLVTKDNTYHRFEEYLDNQNKKGITIDQRLEYVFNERQDIKKLWNNLNDPSREKSEDLEKEFYRRHHQWQRDYGEQVGSYIREKFEAPMPKSMIPDFSLSKRIDIYEKIDTSSLADKKSQIHIEEYKVKSPEGDELVFAMAYNDAGQVYIDNIYDPRIGINDYGIQKQIVNMGHLVFKPEDYNDQTYGISKQDKKRVDKDYDDITALWEKIPVIKKFKEELVRRGVLKQ